MTGKACILVVEDEISIRRLICRALEADGYSTLEADSAEQAASRISERLPDLIILDLGLPDRDGRELLPWLLRAGAAVLVLTARAETGEKVTALDAGADDYVTKPFETDELLARIRTCLRHRAVAPGERSLILAGSVTIDLDHRRIAKDGEEVHLTPKEYELLAELARHAGGVLTHAHLLRSVWGPVHEGDVEYLRVTVRSLRRKLETDPAEPKLIRNEPGVGYRLRTDPS